jgi:two-component sensor histidine kinase
MPTTEKMAAQGSVSSGHLLPEMIRWIEDEFASTIRFVTSAAERSGNSEVKAALMFVADFLHESTWVYRALETPARDGPLNVSAYLERLCRALCRPRLEHRHIRLVLADSPVEMDVDRCRQLGMVIAGLVSNAACREFGASGGTIRVELFEVEQLLICSVTDNGWLPGTVRCEQKRQLVDRLVASLGGTIERKLAPQDNLSVLIIPNPKTFQ